MALGFLFWLEITIIFLDATLQHLQPGVVHAPEHPSRSGLVAIVVLPRSGVGSCTFLGLAQTSLLRKFHGFLKLKQGFGISVC